MYRVELNHAKAEMDTMIQTALDGEEVIITQNDEPILRLTRTSGSQPKQNRESEDGSNIPSECAGTSLQTFLHVARTERGMVIAGTRITLYQIMDHLRAEWPWKMIRDTYNLTDEQINDAMGYINAHREEVEAEYKLVLKQAAEIRAYWEERNRDRLIPPAPESLTPEKRALWEKLQAWKERIHQHDHDPGGSQH